MTNLVSFVNFGPPWGVVEVPRGFFVIEVALDLDDEGRVVSMRPVRGRMDLRAPLVVAGPIPTPSGMRALAALRNVSSGVAVHVTPAGGFLDSDDPPVFLPLDSALSALDCRACQATVWYAYGEGACGWVEYEDGTVECLACSPILFPPEEVPLPEEE